MMHRLSLSHCIHWFKFSIKRVAYWYSINKSFSSTCQIRIAHMYMSTQMKCSLSMFILQIGEDWLNTTLTYFNFSENPCSFFRSEGMNDL